MNKLQLLCGENLQIGGFRVRHPTIKEVIEYGESNYRLALHLFIMRPSDHMVELEDANINWSKLDCFEFFLSECTAESNLEKIGWLTYIDDWKVGVDKKQGTPILYSSKNKVIITKEIYYEIRQYFYSMLCATDKEKYRPANKRIRTLMVEDERFKRDERMKKRKGDASPLATQISALIYSSGGAVSYESVLNLYVYQLNDGLNRVSKIQSYNQIMTAYYSGNVEKKAFNSIIKKMNWMSDEESIDDTHMNVKIKEN